MSWNFRPRFSLRALLTLVTLCAIAPAIYFQPGRLRAYRNAQARARIDPYERSIALAEHQGRLPGELVAILGDSRLKHWNRTGNVQILAGEQIATTGSDRMLRLWDLNTGQQKQLLAAVGMTASGDRKLAFFASTDGSIQVWDAAAGKVTKTLKGAEQPALAIQNVGLAANEDGSTLVASVVGKGNSCEITVWDVTEGTPRHQFRPEKRSGGSSIVTRDGKLFTWVKDEQIQVTESTTGKVVRTIGPIKDGHGNYVIGQVTLSIDETKLYVGSARDAVTIFDWNTGQELEATALAGSSVHTFALGPKDRRMVYGGVRDIAILFQHGLEWRTHSGSTSEEREVGSIDWHQQQIAGAMGHHVLVWNSAHDLSHWRLQGGATSAIRSLAFHPDGERLFTGDSLGQAAVWQVGTWQLLKRWRAHERAIERVLISGDGSKFITASSDNNILVWNPNTGEEVCMLRECYQSQHMGISPDGKLLIADPYKGMLDHQFEAFNTTTGALIRKAGPIKLRLFNAPVWSPDGSRLALLDQSRSLVIFDTASWKPLTSLGKTRFGQTPTCSVWLRDNRRLVTAGWGGDEVHVLDIGKPKPVQTLHAGSGQVKSVALHPSEDWIAIGGWKTPVQLWHLPTSKLVHSWQIGPPEGIVSQVAFSPDGHYLATVNGNGTVYVLALDGLLVP